MEKQLTIVELGSDREEVLRKKAETFLKREIKDYLPIVQEMKKIVREKEGLGLAMPQVGISKRGFVAEVKNRLIAFFNPIILKRTKGQIKIVEGCMSIPGVKYEVWRDRRIQVAYLDEDSKMRYMILDGLDAIVFQHEYDHLNGILISDIGLPICKEDVM